MECDTEKLGQECYEDEEMVLVLGDLTTRIIWQVEYVMSHAQWKSIDADGVILPVLDRFLIINILILTLVFIICIFRWIYST